MEIWVDEGFGQENSKPIEISRKETVRQFKEKYARKRGVSPSEVEVCTDSNQKITNEAKPLSSYVKEGETVCVVPRAKAGM